MSENINATLEIATQLRVLNRITESNALYCNLLKQESGHFNALQGLAFNARKSGDRETALGFFKQQAAVQPDDAQVKFNIATELRELNQVSEADKVFQALLKQDPEDFNVLQGLALNARKKGDRETALDFFKQQAVICPDNLQIFCNIAIELCALSQFDEADIIYNNILLKDSKNFSALHGLASKARKQGNRQEALSQFQNLQILYPERPKPILDVAIELRELGRFEQALDCLETAEQQFSDNFFVPVHQGLVYRQQGYAEKALSYFQKASAMQPLNLQFKLLVASEYFSLGKVSSAIEIMQQVLLQDSQYLEALLQLGNWLMVARMYAEALHFFRQARELYPDQVRPYLLSAQAFLELGEAAKCFAILDKATDILGNKSEVLQKKIQLLWLTRQIEAALVIQVEAIGLFPDDYPLKLQQLNFQIELGQYKEATSNIGLLAASNFNQQLLARLRLALIKKEQWLLAEALKQYQAILKDFPHCIEARQSILLISLINMDVETARKQAYILGQNNLGGQKVSGENRSYLHNHHAQLMDEYQVNQLVLQKIHAATQLPLVLRLQAIMEIIMDDPEVTSGAVTLLAQLRQAGYFESVKSVGAPVISKKIFQYWDKSHPPEAVLGFMQSWQVHHPGYEYRLFDEQKARQFIRQHYPGRVFRCYLHCKHAAQRADVLRLALLAHYGGIYADADDYCLRPLDQLLASGAQLILWQENMATVGNNFIAVTAAHPVIVQALENAVDALERGDNDSIWLSTGPGLISRALAHYIALQWPEQTPQSLGVKVLTQAELMKYDAIHGKLAYKSTNDSWLIKEFSQGSKDGLQRLISGKVISH